MLPPPLPDAAVLHFTTPAGPSSAGDLLLVFQPQSHTINEDHSLRPDKLNLLKDVNSSVIIVLVFQQQVVEVGEIFCALVVLFKGRHSELNWTHSVFSFEKKNGLFIIVC